MVYLVEAFRSRLSLEPEAPAAGSDAGVAAADVRVLGRVFVAADEVCFWLFEAATREALDAALETAGILGSRVSEIRELTLRTAGSW